MGAFAIVLLVAAGERIVSFAAIFKPKAEFTLPADFFNQIN
jgi:hypothetical protein